ncbi:hypothetical protein D3C73_899790 [compost metagenome]
MCGIQTAEQLVHNFIQFLYRAQLNRADQRLLGQLIEDWHLIRPGFDILNPDDPVVAEDQPVIQRLHRIREGIEQHRRRLAYRAGARCYRQLKKALYILADLFQHGKGIAGKYDLVRVYADRKQHKLIAVNEYSAEPVLLAYFLGNIENREQLQIIVAGIPQ